MKRWGRDFLCAIAAVGFVESAKAAPVAYSFTATNFSSSFGVAAPVPTVTGSFTVDDLTVTQLNLVIGPHTYSLDEVGALRGDHNVLWVGGTISGVCGLNGDTTDFCLAMVVTYPTFERFSYAIAGDKNIYSTRTGSISLAGVIPSVPLPASIMAFVSALVVLYARKKSQKFHGVWKSRSVFFA